MKETHTYCFKCSVHTSGSLGYCKYIPTTSMIAAFQLLNLIRRKMTVTHENQIGIYCIVLHCIVANPCYHLE